VHVDNDLAALILSEIIDLELRVPMRWETRATTVRAQMGQSAPPDGIPTTFSPHSSGIWRSQRSGC
jgi:hypothetical protein